LSITVIHRIFEDFHHDQVQQRVAIYPELHQDILETITTLMWDHNPYYQIWLSSRGRLIDDPTTTLKLSIVDVRAQDPRRYNCPTASDVAAIIVGNDGEEEYNRDIIIQNRHTGIYPRISQLHPSYMPMRYPIIFINGEQGWHPSIPLTHTTWDENGNPLAHRDIHNDDNPAFGEQGEDANAPRHGRGESKRVSRAQFYSYHLQVRDIFHPLLYSGRILQEFCINA
jgi:hypothetical protein